MLYFDRCDTERHFGTIRQQIWSFLHFPLHIAFVLTMEGVGQNIVWHQALLGASGLNDEVTDSYNEYQNNATYTGEEFVSDLNSTAQEWFSYAPEGVDLSEDKTEVQEALEELEKSLSTLEAEPTNSTDNATLAVAGDALNNFQFAMINTVLESLKLDPPEDVSDSSEKKTPEQTLNALLDVYFVIYIYFFVAVSRSDVDRQSTALTSLGWVRCHNYGGSRSHQQATKNRHRLSPHRLQPRDRRWSCLASPHGDYRARQGQLPWQCVGLTYLVSELVGE